ncbi:hypothetical protein NG895_29035, partial [Aeoliella sp. ICT_H6.2]
TTAVEAGDLETCDALFDIEFDMQAIVGETEFHYQDKDTWVEQMQSRLDAALPLHRQLLAQFFLKKTTFRFVSTQEEDGERLIVMRASSNSTGELDYYLLKLGKAEEVTVVSLQSLGGGNDPREILKFISRRYAPWETSAGLISEEAPDRTLLSNEKRWGMQLIQCTKRGDYRGAFVAQLNLPKSLGGNLFLTQISLASALRLRDQVKGDGEENARWLEAADKLIEHLESTVPDHPSTALKTIDYHLEKGDPDKALRGIEILRKQIGDDALLRINEGHALLLKQQASQGLEMATNALQEVPYVGSAYIEVAGMYASTGDYDKALEYLDRLYKTHKIMPDEEYLTGDAWVKFFKSDEYQAWKSQHNT